MQLFVFHGKLLPSIAVTTLLNLSDMEAGGGARSSPSLERLSQLCQQQTAFDTSSASTISVALHHALAEHGVTPDWSALLTPSDKQSLLVFASSTLSSPSSSHPSSDVIAWLTMLKIIARSRTALEALFDAAFIRWLVRQVVIAEPAASLEAARLLLNLSIIHKERLHALVLADDGDDGAIPCLLRALQPSASVELTFLVLRVLVFLTVDARVRALCVERHRGYAVLTAAFLSLTEPLASLASSEPSPSPSPSPSSARASPAAQRKAAAEAVKLLTHLCMDDQGLSLQRSIGEVTFAELAERMTALLALNVTIPQQTALLLSLPSSPPSTDDGVPARSLAASPPPPSAQRDQTRLTLEEMRDEAEELSSAADAQYVSLRQLKRDVADCLIYLPGHIARWLEDDLTAVQALLYVLHRALLLAKAERKEEENLVTPVLTALTGVARESRALRRLVKVAVFSEAAVDAQQQQQGPAGGAQSFVPAGSVSEEQLDADPQSLRALLLPYSTTVKYRLKAAVGEFLFQLCDEQCTRTATADSAACRSGQSVSLIGLRSLSLLTMRGAANEYIRLCGFGNAIGLLAERGLPGQCRSQQPSVILSHPRTAHGARLMDVDVHCADRIHRSDPKGRLA